jgi:hypothetical protein
MVLDADGGLDPDDFDSNEVKTVEVGVPHVGQDRSQPENPFGSSPDLTSPCSFLRRLENRRLDQEPRCR